MISAIFTVERGVTKVLLIKRKNEPFYGDWILVGGALHNDEELLAGAKREIKEKTGINEIDLYEFKTFSRVDRSPIMRMVAVGYVGMLDSEKVSILRETEKTSNSDWFNIDRIPKLGYDHEEILNEALIELQKLIINTNIVKALFSNEATLPEIQKVYEAILKKEFDRRNFRKKLLSLKLLEDTGKTKTFEGNKPAKLYRFNDTVGEKNVL